MPAIPRDRFLDAMSRVAATVNVVTTDGPGGRAGVTVSAMTPVSADGAAPTLLICLHEDSRTTPAIAANRCFCINVLREDQASLSDRFAGRAPVPGDDKFDGIATLAMPVVVVFDCAPGQSQDRDQQTGPISAGGTVPPCRPSPPCTPSLASYGHVRDLPPPKDGSVDPDAISR
jgi:hypothetical protein